MQSDAASWYIATQQRLLEPTKSLTGQVKADVVVVGGGVTGCSTALHLAQKGYQVILLEARYIGWGASGRSGGQILPGIGADIEALVSRQGLSAAQHVWDMSCEAVKLVSALVEAHQIKCDLKHGSVVAATKRKHLSQLRTHCDYMRKNLHYDHYRLLEREQLWEHVRSDQYRGGLYDASAMHLHPLNYTLGLALAAQQAGVIIYEYSEALSLNQDKPVRVETAQGFVEADFAVLAGNAYLGEGVAPEIRKTIMPVRDHIIATKPLTPEQVAASLPQDDAVYDTNYLIDYYRLSADKRMLYGGNASYSERQSQMRIWPKMIARLGRLFPALDQVDIDYQWGGLIGITFNRYPHIGRLEPHIYFAQGYSGHGMALGTFSGKLMAQAVAGQAEQFDVFAATQHRCFPGGERWRTPLLLLATTFYRLRDAI